MSQELKRPVDEFMHLTEKQQILLFAGFVRNNTTKIDCNVLLSSAIFVINKFAEFLREKWDNKLKSRYIDINGLTVSLNTYKGIEKSVYCVKTVSAGKHKWTFRYDMIENNNWNLIGIWKTSIGDAATEKHFLNIRNNGYGFCGPQQVLSDPNKPGSGGDDYGQQKCKSGDIVEMILDLNHGTLRYIVNGKDHGIAFESIEKTEYRAAVTLYQIGDKISLISFQSL